MRKAYYIYNIQRKEYYAGYSYPESQYNTWTQHIERAKEVEETFVLQALQNLLDSGTVGFLEFKEVCIFPEFQTNIYE